MPRILTAKSVLHMLLDNSRDIPGICALKQEDRSVSYGEFADAVLGIAQRLIGLKLRGERIAIISGNSIEFIFGTFAIYAAGAQAVPLNPSYTAREIREILIDSDPRAVLVEGQLLEKFEALFNDLGINIVLACEEIGNLSDEVSGSTAEYDFAMLPQPEDLACLLYTGGTTGRPKGVIVTHSQMATNLYQRNHLVPLLTSRERILCFMPMFHSFASHLCMHGSVLTGNTLVIMSRYNPIQVLEKIEQEKITCLTAGPTALVGLLEVLKSGTWNVSTLELTISGSAPLSPKTLVDWEQITSGVVCEGYGQTEAGPVLTFNPRTGRRKIGTVGVPVPDTEIRILDIETGKPIRGAGQAGEICARGPQIMKGYRNRPEENAQTLIDNWLHTGDIGFVDEDGYLTICDRKKDMVIVSGYNVYPREIDNVVAGYSKVLEVASVGVSDDYRGEVIHCFVRLAEPTEDLQGLKQYCEQNLAHYKVPSMFHVVEELPKTTIGKIDRKRLRAGLERSGRGSGKDKRADKSKVG